MSHEILFSKSLSFKRNGKTSHKLRKNIDKRHIVKTKDTANPNMQRTLKTQQENKQPILIWDKDLNRHLTKENMYLVAQLFSYSERANCSTHTLCPTCFLSMTGHLYFSNPEVQ